jgi:hypothetical protein
MREGVCVVSVERTSGIVADAQCARDCANRINAGECVYYSLPNGKRAVFLRCDALASDERAMEVTGRYFARSWSNERISFRPRNAKMTERTRVFGI